jgi:hypothetical protein
MKMSKNDRRFPNMGIEVVMLKARPTSSITHISQSMYSKFGYIHKLDSNQILYKYSKAHGESK